MLSDIYITSSFKTIWFNTQLEIPKKNAFDLLESMLLSIGIILVFVVFHMFKMLVRSIPFPRSKDHYEKEIQLQQKTWTLISSIPDMDQNIQNSYFIATH